VSGGQAILLQVDRNHPERLAGQLRAALLDAIRLGRLPTGTRLPASRVLAQELGVSRGVVVDAYEQLTAEGFLTTRMGSGTVVSAAAEVTGGHLPRLEPSGESLPRLWRPRLDLRPAGPDPAIFPRPQMGKAMMEVLRRLPTSELAYSGPWGVAALRDQLAARLARIRGAVAHADEIIVITGGTQALTLIARTLAAAGHDIIAVEDPGDPVHRRLLHAHGLTPVSVPVDGEGLNVAALEQTACRALLASPSRQFPTGAVMSSARRALVIDWAVRRQAVIIEDDRYAELQPADSAFPCLQGMCPAQVVLIGSVSLTLAPALRLGWLAPPPDLLRPLAEAKRDDDMGTGVFEQHMLASLLESGLYDRHLRHARRVYSARGSEFSRLLSGSFPGWPQRGVRGGLEILLELPDEISELQLIVHGRKLGVGLSGLGPMRVSSVGPHGLVLSYARLTPGKCAQAVAQLNEAVSLVRAAGQTVAAVLAGGPTPWRLTSTNWPAVISDFYDW
jgi:GntR family transcriptional regulator / MocR family aminotransferase